MKLLYQTVIQIYIAYESFYGKYQVTKRQTRLTIEEMLKISREQTTYIVPEEYIKLLQDCWNDDPEMRPTIEQESIPYQPRDILENGHANSQPSLTPISNDLDNPR
ncbi:13519_t:CDS:2, partial [Gigaspora margarita]